MGKASVVDWDSAIEYMNGLHAHAPSSDFVSFIWQRVQMGHRTTELFMSIEALVAMDVRADDVGPPVAEPQPLKKK